MFERTGWLVGRSSSKAISSERMRRRRQRTFLDMESLEHRRLLATRIWDGGGGDALWTTAANWEDDIAPVENDDLVFPVGAAQLTNTNDFTDNTNFASITIEGSGYRLEGNVVDLDGAITTTYSSGTSTIELPIDLQGTRTIGVDAGGALTISGVISGAFGVTKEGGGTLLYGGGSSNTYTGTTAVNAGMLNLSKTPGEAIAGDLVIGDGSGSGQVRLGGSHQIADASSVTVNSGALFDLFGFSDAIGSLEMTGATVQTGVTGTLTLGGDVTTLASNTSSVISGQLNLGGATRIINVADGPVGTDLTISAAISGTGAGMTKSGGGGTLALSGNNSYDGVTTISSGALIASHANALGATTAGTTVASGATLGLQGGITFAVEPITITGNGQGGLGAIWSSSGTNTWTGPITLAGTSFLGAESSAPLTIFGVIDDGASSFGITKVRTGMVTLSAANTYSGMTIVGAGTLLVTGDISASIGGSVNDGGTLGGTGTVGPITASGGTVSPGLSPGILSSGNVEFDASAAFVVELDGTIVGLEYDQLDVTGTVDLGGATLIVSLGFAPAIGNTFTIINNDGNDAITGTFDGLAEGATFELNDVEFTISYVGGDGNDVVLMVPDIFFVWSGASDDGREWSIGENWVGGVAPIPGSRLIFPDSPVRTESINDFADGTAFHSILIAGSGYDLYGNAIELSHGIETTYASGSSAFELPTELTGAQSIEVAAGGTLNFTGALSGGNVLLTKAGGGTLSLSNLGNESGLTGGVIVTEGTLSVVHDDALPSGLITLSQDTTLTVTGTTTIDNSIALSGLNVVVFVSSGHTVGISGIILELVGVRNLYKAGAGTLNLSSANTYTGGTFVNAGTLSLSGGLAISDGSAVTVASGATLRLLASETIGSLAGAGSVDLDTFVLNTGGNNTSTTFSGEISGSGGLTKSGLGTLTLSGANIYTGATTINAGTLLASGGSAIADTSAVTVASGASLSLLASETIGSLAGAGSVVLNANTLTTGGNNGSTSFSGSISETGGLTKVGSGMMTLTGANTYTGATFVSAGVLVVDGSIASLFGTNVSSGATLQGSGFLTSLLVSSGGIVSPGSSPGVLSSGIVEFLAASELVIELGGTTVGTEYDQLDVTGSVTINAWATLSVSFIDGYQATGGEQFTLINNDGSDPIIGTFADVPEGGTIEVGGTLFRVSYVGGDGNDVVATALLSPTILVGSSSNPAVFGSTITFSAAFSGPDGTPTGNATLVIDGIDQETVLIVNGGATFAPISGLAIGTHVVTVAYGGDTFYSSGTGTLTGGQAVVQATTTTSVVSAPNPSSFGEDVTFTVTVGNDLVTPNGNVTLYVNGFIYDTETLNGDGVAIFVVSGLNPGTNAIVAEYDGDSGFLPSEGTLAGGQVVGEAPSSSSVMTSANPSVFGQSVTFTSTVSGTSLGMPTPTGTIQFFNGAILLGSSALLDGTATFTISTLHVGGHSITANYLGDDFFLSSTSPVFVQAVNFAEVELSVIPSGQSGVTGQSLTFAISTATIAPGVGTPQGTVRVSINGVAEEDVVLDSNGEGSITIAFDATGVFNISFQFLNNTSFVGANVVSLPVTITPDATVTTLVSSTNRSVVGQAVTLTATVASVTPGSGTPDGSVSFFQGDQFLGAAPLVNGVATLSVANLPYGPLSVEAAYEGSSNYSVSQSESVSISVTVVLGDYDGDGKADLALYEYVPALNSGQFTILLSGGGTMSALLGGQGAIPVVGDFDGDGRSDMAVFDPYTNGATWFILDSSTGELRSVQFGAANLMDLPAPADYNGDGITDIATFRPNSDLVPGAAQWFILPSDGSSAYSVLFGAAGGMDQPVPADYDGDGKADIATFRADSDLVPGAAQWFILPSDGSSAYSVLFGAAGGMDQPVPADYDGDGKADIATFRTSGNGSTAEWFILPSNGAAASMISLGQVGSLSAPGGYGGPGQTDLGTFDRVLAQWRLRAFSDPTVTMETFGQRSPRVVPVLSPLQDRLDAVGDDDSEGADTDLIDELLANLFLDN